MKSKNTDVYTLITEKIIEQLEQGVIPWHKPWTGDSAPANLISKKAYQGINCLLLNCLPYASPYYLTYRQAQALGGHVKAGEHGYPIIYWQILESEDEDKKVKKIPLLRYFTVFNIEQTEGIAAPEKTKKEIEFQPIEKAEEIIAHYNPVIKYEAQRAFYSPGRDIINMPKKESFSSPEAFYGVLFHEATHHSGHSTRLNRISEHHFFGDPVYSKEELIAEMGACFLCSDAGISSQNIFQNSTAYLRSWISRLQDDKKLLISASSHARKSVEYILGKETEEKMDQ
jgi:antirestriction protein ArdC